MKALPGDKQSSSESEKEEIEKCVELIGGMPWVENSGAGREPTTTRKPAGVSESEESRASSSGDNPGGGKTKGEFQTADGLISDGSTRKPAGAQASSPSSSAPSPKVEVSQNAKAGIARIPEKTKKILEDFLKPERARSACPLRARSECAPSMTPIPVGNENASPEQTQALLNLRRHAQQIEPRRDMPFDAFC